MNTRLRRRELQRPEKLKVGDILSFTSAIIAIVTSAIFYFAGWLYLAHWYSFYGIDMSQLNLSTQLIIIHGVPSILILTIAGIAAMSLFAIQKMFFKTQRVVSADAPMIIILAYGLSFVLMVTITILYMVNIKSIHIPFEVLFAGVISLFLTGLISVLYQLTDILTTGVTITTSIGLSLGVVNFRLSRSYAFYKLIRELLLANKYRQAFRAMQSFMSEVVTMSIPVYPFNLLNPTKKTTDFTERLDASESEFIAKVNAQKQQFTNALTETWQFWLGAVLILYFLVSISTSAVFGEWDARMGKKTMVGGWQSEETYVYSTNARLPLPQDTSKSDPSTKSYVYGPLIILGRSDTFYYLTDWKYEFPYKEKPNVYIVSLEKGVSLGLEILAPTPTPTRVPLNQSTATVTSSPVPSPSVSATATP